MAANKKTRQRIERLLTEINRGIYEKETETSLAMLAALAGESIILLGPPGVAKSMIARRMKGAFSDARSFEYLMSRFSTPDEIFGPVSISQLKSSDAYVRAIDGYLPTADIVFLDEIWKAGPAIQNTLLTVINEKLFRNGNKELKLPLKLLVAASNELPARGEGLEALWDRFLIRVECRNIQQDRNFDAMLLAPDDEDKDVDRRLQISDEEYEEWKKEINAIEICGNVIEAIRQIRTAIRAVAISGTNERRDVYVSDRRWKKIVRLLRASAFMHGRRKADVADLLPIYHCLWQEPEERDEIRNIILRVVFAGYAKSLNEMKESLKEEIRLHRAAMAQMRISKRQAERDADKKLYNNFYYRLTGCSSEHTYIFAQDYQMLPQYGNPARQGVMYNDKRRPQATIIRSYDGSSAAPLGSRPVALARDENHVYIDGVRIEVEQDMEGRNTQQSPSDGEGNTCRDYTMEIEQLADSLAETERSLNDNMFLNSTDRKEISARIAALRKEIAFTRQDTQKLYD